MYLNKVILTIVFIINVTTSFGQSVTDNTEKSKEDSFRKDFSVFRDSLQQVHPALYRYRTQKEMNRLFDSCYDSINNNMTDMQFYMLCKFMVRMVDDGHLLCNLPKETLQKQLATVKVFPLRLWFINDKTYIYCSNDDRFKPGAEIISINNKPVNDIRKILFQYISSDAEIQSRKYVSLNASEASFQFLYYWLYGEKDSFEIEYKTSGNKTIRTNIAAAVLKGNNCFFDKKPVDKYLSLDFEPNNTALLTVKTFAMGKLNKEESYFKVYLDSVFRIIKEKKIDQLIIDVRDNGGGEDHNGSLLYSFLTDKPFSYYSSLSTISGSLPKEIHSNLEIQQPQINNFKGKCYFLINGKSFSTTTEFTAIAKSNNRGVFIGEETGGGYYGNTGSEQAIFTLPYSNIRMIIPKRKYVLAVKKMTYKDRGTIPDYTIVPSINDVLQDKDVQLNYALKLTSRK
ncbi:S41 family peptidase [Flavobacterium sp.]|uniref:S41 family peptidase n=1 Tax=Flavobacterium sp. TaxID=239 RepID=UPI00374FEF72